MTANNRQVGGTHYKTGGEEHWDRQFRLNGAGYFIGCITKYVERYRDKNGIQDLEKAIHYIEKLIELEIEAGTFNKPSPHALCGECYYAAPHHRHTCSHYAASPGSNYVNQD